MKGFGLTVFGTNIAKEVDRLPDYKVFGKVTDVVGLLIEVGGVQGSLSVGDHCEILARNDRRPRKKTKGTRRPTRRQAGNPPANPMRPPSRLPRNRRKNKIDGEGA